MDIYIKMCEGAREIQKLWKPRAGDFTADHKNNVMTVESSDLYTKTLGKKDIKKLAIWWLPRQDQLQEMRRFCSDPFSGVDIIFDYVKWLREENHKCLPVVKYNYTSWEQLWLAFVMQENHNKTWNGKEWVNDHRPPRI